MSRMGTVLHVLYRMKFRRSLALLLFWVCVLGNAIQNDGSSEFCPVVFRLGELDLSWDLGHFNFDLGVLFCTGRMGCDGWIEGINTVEVVGKLYYGMEYSIVVVDMLRDWNVVLVWAGEWFSMEEFASIEAISRFANPYSEPTFSLWSVHDSVIIWY